VAAAGRNPDPLVPCGPHTDPAGLTARVVDRAVDGGPVDLLVVARWGADMAAAGIAAAVGSVVAAAESTVVSSVVAAACADDEVAAVGRGRRGGEGKWGKQGA